MATRLRLSPATSGPDGSHLTATGNRERGTLAAVFYLAGAGVAAVAALDPAARTVPLGTVAASAAAVGLASWLVRRRFVYAATVLTSVLGPVLIAVGVVAGAGSWASALLAGLYTFVAVHTALVLHWQHATAVLVWAGTTAVTAAHLVTAPLPAVAVGVVFTLLCGTLAAVTLWLVAEVRRRATIDPLTGVPNRGSFQAALRHATATVSRTNEPMALIAIDLDGFRRINNTYGHAAGDQVLIDATRAWEPQLRARDHLARIGGDEFCVVLPGADATQARRVADRLEQAMPAGTSCSTGVAMWRDGQPLADLSAAADRELYAAKARRRDGDPSSLGSDGVRTSRR